MHNYSLVRITTILFNNIKVHELGILEWAENAPYLHHSSLTLTSPRNWFWRPMHFHLVIKLMDPKNIKQNTYVLHSHHNIYIYIYI